MKQPRVVIDVTTVVEDAPVRMVISESDSDIDDDEEQQTLPVGFRTKEPVQKRRRQHFMEEVNEEYMVRKEISSDQEISVELKKIEY